MYVVCLVECDVVELFDFVCGLLLCVMLVVFVDDCYWLLLIVYYVIIDGWSLCCVFDELLVVYCVYVEGCELLLFDLLI